jgi:hypothetical protein
VDWELWLGAKDVRKWKHRVGNTSLMSKKKKGTFVAHTSTLHTKWGTMFYLLLPIWTRRNMDFGHLPTHVPSTMLNHIDSDKEEMSTM